MESPAWDEALRRRKKKKYLFAVNNNNNACSCSAQLMRRATREAVAHQMLAALVTQYSILLYTITRQMTDKHK